MYEADSLAENQLWYYGNSKKSGLKEVTLSNEERRKRTEDDDDNEEERGSE